MPQWQGFELCGRYWDGDSLDAESIERNAKERATKYGDGQIVVVWHHDESTFYAHDRRKLGWRHKNAKAEINPKGEGVSEMAGDFGFCVARLWMVAIKRASGRWVHYH